MYCRWWWSLRSRLNDCQQPTCQYPSGLQLSISLAKYLLLDGCKLYSVSESSRRRIDVRHVYANFYYVFMGNKSHFSFNNLLCCHARSFRAVIHKAAENPWFYESTWVYSKLRLLLFSRYFVCERKFPILPRYLSFSLFSTHSTGFRL